MKFYEMHVTFLQKNVKYVCKRMGHIGCIGNADPT